MMAMLIMVEPNILVVWLLLPFEAQFHSFLPSKEIFVFVCHRMEIFSHPNLCLRRQRNNANEKQLKCSLGISPLFNFRKEKLWNLAPAYGDAPLDDVQLRCWHKFIQSLLTILSFVFSSCYIYKLRQNNMYNLNPFSRPCGSMG